MFEQIVTLTPADGDDQGKLKLSAILRLVQDAAGVHCQLLGTHREAMAAKGLFWAVLRHGARIHRLPAVGETITVKTWPMPTTRTAYPRMVEAFDRAGEPLFSVISLWVLMDIKSRGMVLPGKSGVAVEGMLCGRELPTPASLPPVSGQNQQLWQVSAQDLDSNGHVNNTKYLDQGQALANHLGTPSGFTICYLAEALLGQQITLHYTRSETGEFLVDGCRWRTDVPEKTERVFGLRLTY